MKITRLSIILVSKVDDNEIVGSNTVERGGSVGELDASRKKSTKSTSQIKTGQLGNNNAIEESKFITSKARKTFNYLKQAFINASILWHFNSECHIQIETNVSSYAIRGVLNQLTSNQLTSDNSISFKSNVDEYLVAYFFKKMIPIKTWYKTHDVKILAIVEVFKT